MIAISVGFRPAFAPHNDAHMNQLRISFELTSHHLMPMVLEGLSRHEGLAHLDEGILEIDIVLIDAKHDDIVTIVPDVLEWTIGVPIAQPDLSQSDDRISIGSEPVELIQSEIFDDLRIKAQRTGAFCDILGIGSDLRIGVEQRHELRLVDVFSPMAQDGAKRRCSTGVISDLTAPVEETELAHDPHPIPGLPPAAA